MHIHNATILGNQLCEIDSAQGFLSWKTKYKRVVGGLHIWCSANSLYFASLLLFTASNLLLQIGHLIEIYIGYNRYKEILPDGAIHAYIEEWLPTTLLWVAVIFGVVIFLSLVDSKFRRLRVLMASLDIKGLGASLDDFEIIHSTAAAYTVWDIPIRIHSVIHALQILFFTAIVGMYSVMIVDWST